ncbi:SatD family protein [Mesonia aquimarina]|uniref:SatD family protein n=1 Tax=Mesonia aquimarina TaxID=1504967 RepID=UPI001F09FFF6|nr:SatD family protein [Mesonia aquimarina]
MMISILTGDIINSRAAKAPKDYLKILRKTLSLLGKENERWEIFRGDSFQLEIEDAETAFWKSLYIKAALKSIKGLDVRIAIGVGEKSYRAKSISESSGSAFIRSGEMFELLKKEKTNLLIHCGNKQLNREINVSFKLALIAMDNWTQNSAEVVKLSIEYPDFNQQELGEKIGIKQNTVSERQKRAFLEELKEFDLIFREKIKKL